ncbi:MAG: prepilin peptidase [Muricomes sp.]
MPEVSQIGYGIYLCILSITDIWIQKIPVWLVAAGGAAAVAVRTYNPEIPLFLVLTGGLVGVVFLAVSKVTREAFGYGDSLLILVMGIFLGLWNLLGVLLGAFLFSALFAAAFLIYRNMDRKAGYPFIPFLFASYLVWLWLGGF